DLAGASATLVKDIDPRTDASYFYSGGDVFPHSSVPTSLTALNGKLIFAAFDPVHGTELWTSDGTEFGTTLLKDIFTGTDANGLPNSSNPSNFRIVNGKLFFTAYD